MGCCNNKAEAIQGLRDEIKSLQEQKSRLLIEQDSLKEAFTFYSLSDDDIVYQLRKLTAEYNELEEEIARIENLYQQSTELIKTIAMIDASVKDSESSYNKSQHSLARLKQEYLAKTEELNDLLKESSNFSSESRSKSKEFQDMAIALQENKFLEERKRNLTEKIETFKDANEKVDKSSIEIFRIERKIKEFQPLIEKQNKLHGDLLEIDDEIGKLKSVNMGFEISASEKKYLAELEKQLQDLQAKNHAADKKIEQFANYNMDKILELKESNFFIRETLKQDIKDATNEKNQGFIMFVELQSKKSSLQNELTQKSIDFDKRYEKVCFKLQKKQAKKASLESQLKEFKELAEEINF